MLAPPWPDVRAEILALYAYPLHPRSTIFAVRRVCDQLELLGVTELADLTPELVGRFARRTGLAPRTVRGQIAYLSVICRYCQDRGWIGSNPVAARRVWVPARVLGTPRRRHLTTDQVAKILRLATIEASSGAWQSRRLEALVYLLAFTGLRKSEALGLQVADLDPVGRTVVIRPNADRSLKTVGSAATLPVPSGSADVLARWLPATGGLWVFPSVRSRRRPWLQGGPGSRALDQVKALGTRAGVPGTTLTAFRHSWATRAESVGLTGDQIRRMLRHTTESTSWEHYRASDAELIRPSAERVVWS